MGTDPLLVVGAYRSGTTLMRRILNSHPEVWLAKETQYLAHLTLAPGDWDRELAPAALAEHLELVASCAQGTGWSTLPSAAAFAASGLPPTAAAVYAWACSVERPADRGSEYWGDNSPRYALLLPMLAQRWPGLKVVHMVRDPRAVVASVLDLPFGPSSAGTAAIEWTERVGAALAAEHQLGAERVLHLRFEDLVADPRAATGELAAFLGLDDHFEPDAVGGDSAQVATQPHLQGIARAIDPSVVHKWKAVLSAAQVARVEAVCQPWLAAFGYPLGTWRAAADPTEHYGHLAREYASNITRRWLRTAQRTLWRG